MGKYPVGPRPMVTHSLDNGLMGPRRGEKGVRRTPKSHYKMSTSVPKASRARIGKKSGKRTKQQLEQLEWMNPFC